MTNSIPIILGTTRKNNQSQNVAQYLHQKLSEFPNVNTQILDLGEAQFPILEERLEQMSEPPIVLTEWIKILKNATAIIIVAPEYKNAYPGSLKNFLDLLPAGIFRYKPIGISSISAGQYGGANCLAQLRLVCLSLAGLPIPDRLMISGVTQAFDENGDFKDEKTVLIADKFLKELLKYTQGLAALD